MGKKTCTAVFLFAAAISVISLVIYLFFYKGEPDKVTKSIFAFDTLGEITIYGEDESTLKDVMNKITELDNKLDGYDESSELYKLNKTKESSDKDIYQVINQSVSLYESYGLVDITIGELIYLWDISGDSPSVPKTSEIEKALKSTGISNISSEDGKIRLNDNTTIELGAVAKGYLLNELKTVLKDSDSESALINFGSSILLYGDRSFNIGVKNPFEQGDIIATLSLNDETVSTSGGYERFFEAGGNTYSHILNTETGYPVESDLASVTVICKDALTGDFLSTAAYIMGSEELLKRTDELRQDEIYILAVKENNEILVSKEMKDKLTLKNKQFKITII